MSVVPHLLESLDLHRKEDITADLKKNKMKKNAQALKSICHHIEETINPFSYLVDPKCLLNIETGKAASDETLTFLLNVKETGNKQRESFIKEVNERPARFEEPIKCNKMHTFQNEGLKPKNTNNKVSELKMERKLYGRLLCVAIEKSVDLSVILKYPITPVPLSM